MKCYCFVICVIVFGPPTLQEQQHPTLSIHQRVNLLKRQLKDQINRKQITSDLLKPIDVVRENYEYVDIGDQPITPIMSSGVRKQHDRFKLREIVTEKGKPENHSYRSGSLFPKKRKHIRNPKARYAKPLDTFYRRAGFLTEDSDAPVEWLHCQDLITPFFSGYKSDISVTKRLPHTDHAVVRFIQLLSLNITGHGKEEIYSILYQISNLQLRLFQWDVPAINLLFNVLVKDRSHTFKNVIYGVRSLLASWHLDIGNTTNLLKQSRIFRPPCVKVSHYEGSTKTSKRVSYTKATVAKSTCADAEPGDDVCD